MSIFDLFPVPRYLSFPVFGFDLSDRSLKYLELLRTRQGRRLGRFGEAKIPQGLIEDGQILKKEELISLLKDIQKERGVKYIAAALPEEKVFLRAVKLPAMEEREIKVALESQLEENVPLAASEAVFDYEIIPETDKNGHLDVNLAAAPKNFAESYAEVFQKAGFQPLAFDLESRALVRSLVAAGDNSCQMIINFGATATNFVIAVGGKARFAAVIKAAGRTLDQAIAKAFSVSLPEAEKIKKEKFRLGKTAENDELFNALLPVVSAVAGEVGRHINYWESHQDEHGSPRSKIEKMILAGGDANLSGLVDYFSHRLGLPVEYGNVWANVFSLNDELPEISFKDSLRYAVALGLALFED